MKFPLNSEIYDFQSFTQRIVVQNESFKGQSTGKWQLGVDVSRDSPLKARHFLEHEIGFELGARLGTDVMKHSGKKRALTRLEDALERNSLV